MVFSGVGPSGQRIRGMHRTVALAIFGASLLATPLALTPGLQAQKTRTTRTVTHRVVVVNGETVVDEKKVDGKVVPSGGVVPPVPRVPPAPKARPEKVGPGKVVTRSSSSRKVIVNGEVVVDEQFRNGKPVSKVK